MQGLKERITQSQELLRKIQARREEVQSKATEARTAHDQSQQHFKNDDWWNSTRNYTTGFDDLEEKFRRWETEDELEQMKRDLNK
jgi:predicted RNA-binding protein with RPS1 domain